MKDVFAKDLAPLVLRVGFGVMMLVLHGWPKLLNYAEKASTFPDPLGAGHIASFWLVIFAEVFCSIAVIFGLFTRLAAIPLAFNMLVAVIMIHGSADLAGKESALVYALAFIAILFLGPGRISLDYMLRRAS